jgi:hypothetical protein
MATANPPWDEADANRYVRDLFEHVLRLVPPPENEIAAWTKRAIASGDPVAIFRAVIEMPIHKQHMAAELDASTRWPPGHFYSPSISRREVAADRDRVFGPRSLAGIDLRLNEQIALLRQLAPYFSTIPFPEEATPPYRYRYKNSSYGYGDAVIYWAILNLFRPRQIVEIGSGFTSALALDTIDILDLPTVCTFVDPYPQLAEQVTAPLRPPHRIIPQRVQDIDPAIISSLQEGDLLFIDSSHVLKSGSDVHAELTNLLPRLRPGVLVHFHDAFNNFEYPEPWVVNENRGWNELYALHLFLMYNGTFRIEYFNHFLASNQKTDIQKICPGEAPRILLNPGGGLWLRRV